MDGRLVEGRQAPALSRSPGIDPKLSDAELVTLAVMQALLGFTSEARWLRHARAHLRHLFPYLPQQPGYNKRLRAAASLIRHCIRALAAGTTAWTDDVWVIDSTPVECGRSRETARRSDLAGWAEYGYCASHSRYFWGLRLHLVATVGGLPVGFALSGAKADERQVLLAIFDADPGLLAQRPGQTLIGDKNYYGRGFEATLAEAGARLLRPARQGEPESAAAHLFRPLRQVIESVNETFKGQLDLERHGGHTPGGVIARVLQRILALEDAANSTASVAANALCAAPVRRLPVPGTGAAGFGGGEPRATVVPKTRGAGSVLLSAFHAAMLIELLMVREKAHTREGDAIAAARPAAADGGGGLHPIGPART